MDEGFAHIQQSPLAMYESHFTYVTNNHEKRTRFRSTMWSCSTVQRLWLEKSTSLCESLGHGTSCTMGLKWEFVFLLKKTIIKLKAHACKHLSLLNIYISRIEIHLSNRREIDFINLFLFLPSCDMVNFFLLKQPMWVFSPQNRSDH